MSGGSDELSSSKDTVHVFGRSVTTWVTFTFAAIFFVFVSTLETTLVKDYNFEFNLIWPCYTAFLLSCGWPLQAIPLFFKSKLVDNKVNYSIRKEPLQILD